MKKFLIILLITFSVNFSFAQTLKQIAAAKKQAEMDQASKKVVPPIMVRAAFAKDFPNTAVKWEKERGHFEANFSANGVSKSVLYADNGQKIETETILSKNAMPANVMNYIDSHFKGEPISETSIIKKSNGMEEYEVEIKGKIILFTKEGKYIKTVKD